MNLDVNTLFVVTIYVEAILGLLLLFAWMQNTAITAVAWWGFADLLRAASVARDSGRFSRPKQAPTVQFSSTVILVSGCTI